MIGFYAGCSVAHEILNIDFTKGIIAYDQSIVNITKALDRLENSMKGKSSVTVYEELLSVEQATRSSENKEIQKVHKLADDFIQNLRESYNYIPFNF